MSGRSFRFLQSGGFQLHAVLQGITDAPDYLLDLLASAPYRAVESVIQTALREEVDFVVFTGDLLDAASGGPRGVAFLVRQLEILGDNGIPVYWAASQLDLASNWLSHVELSRNVHIFSEERVEQEEVVVSDRLAAILHGRSWNPARPVSAGEFAATSQSVPQVAVLYGACDNDSLSPSIGLWSVGGASDAFTNSVGKQVIHCAGWPQGFAASQEGAHGCTLVNVDHSGEVRTRRVETDAVRWTNERISIPNGTSLNDIRSALRLRVQKLISDAGRSVLVHWMMAGDGWYDSLLARQDCRDDLLQWLRDEFGKGSAPCWSLSLDVEPPDQLRDEWTDEDSILGDYLRVTREFLESDTKPLDLEIPAAAKSLPDPLRKALAIDDTHLRVAVLREAVLAGVGLLRGEERPMDALMLTGTRE